MATGILATMGASASVTYAPLLDAKVMISTTTANAVTINGTAAVQGTTTYISTAQIEHFVGAGSSTTIATPASGNAVVSVLEAI